jgi:mono/diheme cytochrome c family protein
MYRTWPLLIASIALTIGLAQQPTAWEAPPEAKKLKNKVSLTGEKVDGVSRIYREKCVSCHGTMGDSHGPAATGLSEQPADFTQTKIMAKIKDGELFWKIGAGHAPMPAYAPEISETDRWQLVNYVRYLTKLSEYKYLGNRRTPTR